MTLRCKLCELVDLAVQGRASKVLWESPYSLAVVGDHQFYEGYGMVISKVHAREMHHLESDHIRGLFDDVMRLGRAIETQAKKLAKK
jgi:diadenosine tetraphosphate (Ap4A) HIT family hydrolase